MLKVSMGGSGVINFDQLKRVRPLLGTLSALIDYPTETTFSADHYQQIATDQSLAKPERKQLLALFQQLGAETSLQREVDYSNLFEMNRRYTLYMTYYKMIDSRQRGSLLAKLKMLYEMFGVSENSSELSDYLPLMLEFLAYGDYLTDYRKKDLELAFSVIEDGTYNLQKNAVVDADKPYIQLVKLIRQVVGSCVKKEVGAHE